MNLSDEMLVNIVKFQKKFKSLKHDLKRIEGRLLFLKDYLLNMVNNISYMKNINIFESNDLTVKILNNLNYALELTQDFPEDFKVGTFINSNFTITKMNLNLIKISNELKKYSNIIAPNSFNYIMKLYYDTYWINNFPDEDLDLILFLSRFMNIISVWESESHIKEIKLNENSDESKIISKDILENLLGKNSVIVSSQGNIPSFLKNISSMIEKNLDKPKKHRKNNFKRIDCISILDKKKIVIKKNPYAESLIEDKLGVCVFLRLDKNFMVIQGIFKDDLMDISKTLPFVNKKYIELKKSINYDILIIPKEFKENYLKTLNLRDILVSSPNDIVNDLKKKYLEFKNISEKTLLSLINEFLLASKYRKIDILTLLLMSDLENKKLGYILFDVLKTKDKKGIANEIYNSLHHSIRNLLDNAKNEVIKEEERLSKIDSSDIPYERRISLMKTDDSVKSKALEKYKSMKSGFQGDNKAQAWLDGVLKIPFGVYKENPIMNFKYHFCNRLNAKYPGNNLKTEFAIDNFIKNTDNIDIKMKKEWIEYQSNKIDYLKQVRKTFDDAVFGHKEAKLQLERIFAQWINGESKGAILGLHGPPGTGKTSLAKRGLSQCLKDKDGNSRPFAFLPIGGSVNGSTLVGHNYTYVGSSWGRIVDILMTSECMNPIIFIDEIDKVSHTEHGREIISILTHLTDLTQNDEFEDKYFAGVKLDLSKALIVFSFNDASLIDPILRDRITIIETKPLSLPEKITILKDYMIPEIFAEVGFDKNEIIFTDDVLEFIISTYTNEAGVRKIKEKIYEIIRNINLERFHDTTIMLPYFVTHEYVEKLFEDKPRIRIKKIANEPAIGMVNGLYATVSGIGGLTLIQVMKYPSKTMLELNLTGKQGDVMKESVNYALKIAFNLLPEELKEKIIEDANNNKSFGFHVHTPDAATPKDGPSAGAAITLAIYSQLTGKKVNNKIAMTGEIDLCGSVTAIGGVNAKLNGAKKAGAEIVLIPEENEEDLIKLRRDGLSPEDENFKVICVNNIHQVFEYALIEN